MSEMEGNCQGAQHDVPYYANHAIGFFFNGIDLI